MTENANAPQISDSLSDWLKDALMHAQKNSLMISSLDFFATMNRQVLPSTLISRILSNDPDKIENFDVDVRRVVNANSSRYELRGNEKYNDDTYLNSFTKQVGETVNEGSNLGAYHFLLALVSEYENTFKMHGITPQSLEEIIPTVNREYEGYSAKINQSKRERAKRNSDTSPHEMDTTDAKSSTPLLDKYGKDLTERAANGELDPTIGRDDETRQIIKILSRRTKNTPVLVGEPGVGKTKIIEGIAQRITDNDVPKSLVGRKLISLDMTSVVAGANMRGQFEERLQGILKEVQDSAGLIVLFINEIHVINSGDNGAGDILKPALASGLIRLIGSTAPDDFRTHIESDTSIMRLLQKIEIDEPTKDEAVTILRGVASRFESYHEVQISDEALIAAVEMSEKYVPTQVLPDKAIDIIDEAATKLRIELDSSPVEIDKKQRALDRLRVEEIALLRGADIDLVTEHLENTKEIVRDKTEADSSEDIAQNEHNKEIKERALASAVSRDMLDSLLTVSDDDLKSLLSQKTMAKLLEIRAKKSGIEDSLTVLRVQWDTEQKVRKEITELRKEIKEKTAAVHERTQQNKLEEASAIEFDEIPKLQKKLEAAQKKLNNPLVPEMVSTDEVAKVVEGWTGIPVGKLLAGEAQKLMDMEKLIGQKVIGQDRPVKVVSEAVRRSRAGVNDPNKPTGSFMFLGTSGTGKTYLAECLAEFLFDNKESIVRLDMSEYGEKHATSKLIGSPPGYVGYESGGILTEAVRKNPYSVVLFDEVEKAHPETWDTLLQVLDSGHLTDSQGVVVDFKNTIIVLTSNLGAKALIDDDLNEEEKHESVMSAVRNHFRPEFLNRLDDMVIFNPFALDDLIRIVDNELAKFAKRLENRDLGFSITDSAKKWLAENGYDPSYGARPLKRLIQRELGDEASNLILSGKITEGDTLAVGLSRDKKSLTLKAKK